MKLRKALETAWMATAVWLGPAMAAGEIHWTRIAPHVPAQAVNAIKVPCGAVGVYYFSNQPLVLAADSRGIRHPASKAAGAASIGAPNNPVIGQETPRFYTRPGALMDGAGWNPDGQSWFNGYRGSWVAVIDFEKGPNCPGNPDNCPEIAHGQAVAWTIRLLSDHQTNVALFPLDEDLPSLDIPAASDAHFLIQLCDLAQYIEDHPNKKPLAVNMSFGRLADDDLVGCDPDQERTLSCQIRAVLDLLSGQGIALIAASGNYVEDTFPAGYRGVFSVGRLNLHGYDGLNSPGAWQNPPGASACFPGDGLSLERVGEASQPPPGPLLLPSGSSFAAAAFTGLLSPILADGVTPLSLWTGLWFPKRDRALDQYALYNASFPDLDAAPSSELARLFTRLKTTTLDVPDPVDLDMSEPLILRGPFSVPSFPNYIHRLNVPWPETKPCLPCFGFLLDTTLLVDMSEADYPEGLQDLYLRIGDLTYYATGEVDPSRWRDGLRFELGEGVALGTDDEVSVVFVVGAEGGGEESFWISANVLISDHLLDEEI